jgi:NitT/TauT family transport system ATP-binding protein
MDIAYGAAALARKFNSRRLIVFLAPPMSETSSPLVALRNVSKTFANGVKALEGFDFTVRDGEFVSLLGPSGCGKSTALQLISGLGNPSEGDVTWSDAIGRPGKRRHDAIGFVFQEPTLMPWASVFENVYLPLRLQGVGRSAAAPRVNEMLGGVGLAEFTAAYPRELSGGMRMRVSIARALVTNPKLVLMDEPFAALDEITRFRLNDDLLGLYRKLQKTVIFVTHSVYESVFLSTRIVVMMARPGRVFSEIAINAPYPRNASFRTSPEYAESARQTSEALAVAMSDRG